MKYGDQLIISGDWNGHVGTERDGYEDIIGPHSVGNRNPERDRIISFALVNRLSIMNTFFGTEIVISGRGIDGAQRGRDIQTDL